MNIPDWLKTVNAYNWLVIVSVVLIAISIIYNDKYMRLWLLTFIYGLFGFANNAGVQGEFPVAGKIIAAILLLAYAIAFLCFGFKLTDVQFINNEGSGRKN